MNKQFRGGIIYLVIVLVIMYFIMSITSFGKSSSSYGYSDFLNDFQAGNVDTNFIPSHFPEYTKE